MDIKSPKRWFNRKPQNYGVVLLRKPVGIVGLLGMTIMLPRIHCLATGGPQKAQSTNDLAIDKIDLIHLRPKIDDTSYSWTDEVLGKSEIDDEDTYEMQGMQQSLGTDIPQQLPKPAVKIFNSRHLREKPQLEISKSRRLSPQEELELARNVQAGVSLHQMKTDFELSHGREITKSEWMKLAGLKSTKELRKRVSQYRRSKQKLVESNMGLVRAVVRNLYRNGDVTYEELIQEGSLGLIRAAELFDPSRGIRFSTYGTIWIKGILSNSHLKETITLPQREKTKWNRIKQIQKELLEKSGGREPTFAEIAQHMNVSAEEVALICRRMIQAQKVQSLDGYTLKSGTKISSDEVLRLDKSVMSDIDVAELTRFHTDLVTALAKNLSPREARLMRLRYGLTDGYTRTIQECADEMGLSKTRTQQLAKSCLQKLREASDAESLQEYLVTIA
mmetsp:Transcript_30734/g.46595  ORF Transcript_30734/g.46595 Transcript_30734/m.46595 type:complete len:446 (-) Transcript_30734:3026-4363(-)